MLPPQPILADLLVRGHVRGPSQETRAGPQPPHARPGREERKNEAHTRGATTLPPSPTHSVYYCFAARAYSPYNGTRPTLDTNTLMLLNSAHEMWLLPNVQHPFQVSGWARSGGDPEIDSMMLVSLDGSGRSPFFLSRTWMRLSPHQSGSDHHLTSGKSLVRTAEIPRRPPALADQSRPAPFFLYLFLLPGCVSLRRARCAGCFLTTNSLRQEPPRWGQLSSIYFRGRVCAPVRSPMGSI